MSSEFKRNIRSVLVWVLKHFSNSNLLYEEPSPFPRYTPLQAEAVVAAMVEKGILREGSMALPIADTGSEDPAADAGHFFIAEPLFPLDAVRLYIGDWIIADSPKGLRAHHIVEMFPSNGTIEIKTRGTFCIADDKEITFPSDLRYLVVGVLYGGLRVRY